MLKSYLHIILKLSLFFLCASLSMGAAASPKIQKFSGFSHFAWLQKLQESPDHIQGWEKGKPSLPKNMGLHVSYPKSESSDQLVIKSGGKAGGHRLQLASLTSFKLNSGVEYFGFHHFNSDNDSQSIELVFTLEDVSVEKHRVQVAKQGLSGFVGFLPESGVSINRVDMYVSNTANVSVDNVQWGRLSNPQKKSKDKNILSKNEQTRIENLRLMAAHDTCTLRPELVQLQCDSNKQWLLDVKVSGDNVLESWWCSDDKEEQCGSYGKTVSYSFYPNSDAETVKILFTDQRKQSCASMLSVSLSGSCQDSCSYQYNDGDVAGTCEDKKGATLVTAIDAMDSPISIHAKVNSVTRKNTTGFVAYAQKRLPHLPSTASRLLAVSPR